MENQTWWDAACNLDPENNRKDWWGYNTVTSENQFMFVLDNQYKDASSEESFMFLCFMSEAFDHDQ